MVRLTCSAACGNFEMCLIACPQNSTIGSTEVPACEPLAQESIDDEEAFVIVIEEKGKGE